MTNAKAEILPKPPVVFDEFFEMGLEESLSPFLTPRSRKWGINLTLKASLLAALLLLLTFLLSWSPTTLPLSYLLLIFVYFLAGIPSLIQSLEDILILEINIDVLMTLAAFSSVLIGNGMEGGLLLVLFALSGSMEDAVTAKAKGAISSLHKLSPTKASVIDSSGMLLERSVKDISVGTHILVKAGEVVPLDGVVTEGVSSVNLVHLTGENLPATKKEGDDVPAGAQNLEGVLTLQVTHTTAESTVARIIKLVTQAQEARPKLQRWFDKLSKRYAIAIICFALFFALSLPWVLGLPYLGTEGSVYRALAFLIAASPCALIIAIPIAYLSAVSACARKGVLLKGGITLDALASCSVIAFDKTGTLTTGDLSLVAFEAPEEEHLDEKQALTVAVALEKNVVHPIARAVCDYGEKRRITATPLENFRSIPGYGLEAIALLPTGKTKAYIGRPEYVLPKISEQNREALQQKIAQIQERGELLTVLVIGDKIFYLRFFDTLRPKMKETIQTLKKKKRGELLMLTGDHESSAKRIADELGIEKYYAQLSPEGKLDVVSTLAQKQGLAMVGDGINDAPSLARATVGICMGKVGSTTAMEAADIVLLQDNLEFLDWLIRKAHQTQAIVRENLILATAAILFASFPALGGLVPLWLAVILHEGGTVLVGLNALRLLRR